MCNDLRRVWIVLLKPLPPPHDTVLMPQSAGLRFFYIGAKPHIENTFLLPVADPGHNNYVNQKTR